MSARLVLLVALFVAALSAGAGAGTLRLATWHLELDRDGPGLLLRDLRRGGDPRIKAIAGLIAAVAPDVLVVQGVDYDHGLRALSALRDRIAEDGPYYSHLFALRPNTGWPTGLDMDGDGRRGGPRDAQGYGTFSGQGGMAILSRYPLDRDGARDFSAMLWRDLPGALLPRWPDGRPFPSQEAQAVQRLSSVGHWVVPLRLPSGSVSLMTFHATTPVFDGEEDRNGRRNHDEIRFWQRYLDGAFGNPPARRFVVIGDANLDPNAGEGRRGAIRALLADPRLRDPLPGRATVAWDETGPLRVSYILPSADLVVAGAGIHWPPEDAPDRAEAEAAGPHRLIWVDLTLD
ncbi:endonuclease/exonuclease/phosphatase family protein [Roseovarius sp. A46]|uniref:endonuclease/exonuclease/phosphatase family protein n=1 Tax=Roseovarius sp. A46 TaxID=2109331 RepID=UPI001F50832D|nr:endonuclease/exonuclease/phosphatase family protein [Roseovarius sp. A46]